MMPMQLRRTRTADSVRHWLSILLFATTRIWTTNIHAQSIGAGGSPWIIPFGIKEEESVVSSPFHEPPEFFASALVYDSKFDRIYVTGVTRTRKHATNRDTPTVSPTDDANSNISNNDDYDGGDDSAQYSDDDSNFYSSSEDDDDYHTSSNGTSAPITKSDCFLGILQIPRRSNNNGDAATSFTANSNDWVRQHTHIGTRESQEACSGIDIVRRGNDHKVYLIGHSILGPSLLENQLHWYNSTHQIHEHYNETTNNHTDSTFNGNSTNSTIGTAAANQTAPTIGTTSNQTPVVYGFVMDVTWYNGHVPTGYLMHHVPVEYPIGITASSSVASSHEDLCVVSIQSLSGMINPAHTMYENLKRQTDGTINVSSNSSDARPMLYDTTTSGSYLPPAYGESYSFNLRRIGERSQSLMDVMTLPGGIDSNNNTTMLYASKIEGSKLLNLLKLSKTIKTAESNTVNVTTTASAMFQSSNTTNSTNTSSSNTTTSLPAVEDVDKTKSPLSFGEYGFVVEPLVERWGRTFSANIQEETSTNATTKVSRPALYSIQVSSILRCTITTLEESNVVPGEYDDDTSDDTTDDDAITYVQRRQDMIFVAGSTRGSGLASGGDVADTSLHGFVSSFDATTGVLLRRIPIVTTTAVTTTSSSNTVSRNPGYTVRVFGMCQQDPNSQPIDVSIYRSAHYIYVVGMTDGILDHQSYTSQELQASPPRVGVYRAFLQKIDAITLAVQWTKQIGAAKFLNGTNTTQYGSIHGIACAVTPDGFQVYLGGTVIGGASITIGDGSTSSTKSYGRDDIFVAQYTTSDGRLNYVKQIGTPQDDTLANGVSIVADKYGNAIVLGNTRGSLFGLESTMNLTNKVIVLSIDRMNGNHVDISGETKRAEDLVDPITSEQPTPGPTVGESSISPLSDLSKVNVVYICIMVALLTTVLASAEKSINKSDLMHDDVNAHQTSDVENAKLFTTEHDREYSTESSYDDDYETVSFVPSSQQEAGQTPLHSVAASCYKDTLLLWSGPNLEEEATGRARTKRTTSRNARVEQRINDSPLRRWLVRDP